MALAAAGARAKGEAVNTELTEDFANEQVKIRVRIGKRSAVFAVYNADVERVQGGPGGGRESGAADSGCAVGDPGLNAAPVFRDREDRRAPITRNPAPHPGLSHRRPAEGRGSTISYNPQAAPL